MSRQVKISALREYIQDHLVEDYLESYYILEHPKPTLKQLTREVMAEIEPAIQQIKKALEKNRPNLNY